MSMLRMRAAVTGLLEVGKVNEWVVTEKLGAVPEATQKLSAKPVAKQSQRRTTERY